MNPFSIIRLCQGTIFLLDFVVDIRLTFFIGINGSSQNSVSSPAVDVFYYLVIILTLIYRFQCIVYWREICGELSRDQDHKSSVGDQKIKINPSYPVTSGRLSLNSDGMRVDYVIVYSTYLVSSTQPLSPQSSSLMVTQTNYMYLGKGVRNNVR